MAKEEKKTINTITDKNDFLNRNEIIEKLVEITKSIDCSNDNRSFAIEGEWGVGKSFIIDKFENKIKSENDIIIFKYNAWENNYYEEPIIAMVTSMIDQLNNYYDKTFTGVAKQVIRDTAKSLLEILKTLGKSTAILLGKGKYNEIADEISSCGKNLKKTINRRMIDNDVDEYLSLKQTLTKLRVCLSKLNKKIVFIIDEIDRCLPDYAVKVLERTHHLFEELSNSITIFSIDQSQLGNLIKSYYGDDFDIEIYMQKFIEFTIPIGLGVLDDKCDELFEKYLKNFVIADDEKEDLIQFFKSLTTHINIRKKIRLINRLNEAHELFVKEKCNLSLCYFEIYYVVFYDYYGKQTETFKINYISPKGGIGLNGFLKNLFPKLFEGVQLTDVYINSKKYDAIEIKSMNEYKNLLFYYIRYSQHKQEYILQLLPLNGEELKELKEQIYEQCINLDKFVNGIKFLK